MVCISFIFQYNYFIIAVEMDTKYKKTVLNHIRQRKTMKK